MNTLAKNILTTITGVALAFLVLQFIQPTLVNGDSMDPYLKNGDYLIMNKVAYTKSDPEYGDVIIFPREGHLLIKRVIGKPGDKIEIRDGKVYKNGEQSDFVDVYTEPEMTVTLKDDEYFCLGDNRDVSKDSRDVGVGNIKKSERRGKAVIRLFPRPGKI